MVKCCTGNIHTRREVPPWHVHIHDRAFGSGRWGEGRASPSCHGARCLARWGAMKHHTGWGKRCPSVPMESGRARAATSWKPTRIGPCKALRAAKSVCTGRMRAISIQLSTGWRWAQHASISRPVGGFRAWFPAAKPLRPGVSRVVLWLLGSTHLLRWIQPLLLLSTCHHHLERILAVGANSIGHTIEGFSPYCSLSGGMPSNHRRRTLRRKKKKESMH